MSTALLWAGGRGWRENPRAGLQRAGPRRGGKHTGKRDVVVSGFFRASACLLLPGKLYGDPDYLEERHRHRFEVKS